MGPLPVSSGHRDVHITGEPGRQPGRQSAESVTTTAAAAALSAPPQPSPARPTTPRSLPSNSAPVPPLPVTRCVRRQLSHGHIARRPGVRGHGHVSLHALASASPCPWPSLTPGQDLRGPAAVVHPSTLRVAADPPRTRPARSRPPGQAARQVIHEASAWPLARGSLHSRAGNHAPHANRPSRLACTTMSRASTHPLRPP